MKPYTPIAYGVDTPWADKQNTDVYNHTPRAFLRCLVIDCYLKFIPGLQTVKTKA